MKNIDLEDWSNYTDSEKEIMIKLLEVRQKLDLVDIMMLKNIKRTEILLDHFANKIKKEESND
jgi:hypothetical protein